MGDRNWHAAEVFGTAAIPPGYRVTCTVSAIQSACLFVTLSGLRLPSRPTAHTMGPRRCKKLAQRRIPKVVGPRRCEALNGFF
jgi:hypothetical protein